MHRVCLLVCMVKPSSVRQVPDSMQFSNSCSIQTLTKRGNSIFPWLHWLGDLVAPFRRECWQRVRARVRNPPTNNYMQAGRLTHHCLGCMLSSQRLIHTKQMMCTSTGRSRIRLQKTGEVFSLVPPPSKANNVIIGRVWIDTAGDYSLINTTTGAKCSMYFTPCGWFGSGRYEVETLAHVPLPCLLIFMALNELITNKIPKPGCQSRSHRWLD